MTREERQRQARTVRDLRATEPSIRATDDLHFDNGAVTPYDAETHRRFHNDERRHRRRAQQAGPCPWNLTTPSGASRNPCSLYKGHDGAHQTSAYVLFEEDHPRAFRCEPPQRSDSEP